MAGELNNLRWIFFDVGFTLVDESHCMSTRFTRAAAAAADYGVDTNPAQLWHWVEQGYAAQAASPFRAALERLPLSSEQVDYIAARSPYEVTVETLYPGVPDLLTRMAAAFHLGVLANQVPGLPDRLEALGIADAFDVVLGSGDEGMGKPQHRFFERAVAATGAAPAQIAMVGDRLDNDIRPANELGWWTVWVRQGMARGQVPRTPLERPGHVVDRVGDLALLL